MAKYGDVVELIAKRLGLTAEETMEKLGKKIPAAAEEVNEASILKNLNSEAQDIAQPLGSGKNLDALSRAKADAPGLYDPAATAKMQRDVMNAPFVDTGYDISTPVSQYKGVGSADYGLVPAKTPDFLNPKPSQMGSPVSPLAATAESLKGSVDDALSVPGSKWQKPAVVVGLGAAGYGLMSGEDQQAQASKKPLAPVKAPEPKTPEELKSEVKKTVRTEAPKVDGLDFDALSKKLDTEMANLPKDSDMQDDTLTDSQLMNQALEKENQNRFMNIMLRAGIQAGSAIAGGSANQIKPDYSGVDALEKGISSPVSSLKTMMDTESKEMSKKQLQAELSDEKAMRDPNSEISRMVTGIAQKVGILKPGQTSSAMALKNAGVNLGTLLATIEAGNARRDAAALARETSDASRRERMDMKSQEEDKKRIDKRKLVTEEIEARKRTIGDNIKRARDIVEKYGTVEATGPQAELLQGMLDEIAVDTAKLQDPDSVARPAEVQLVRQSLIPEDTLGRMSMTNKTAKTILDEFEKRINERAAIGYKVRGIDQPINNNLGGMVKVQAPNGKIKLIPADQVDAALAAGGKLVE